MSGAESLFSCQIPPDQLQRSWFGVTPVMSSLVKGGMRTRNSFSEDGYKKDPFLSGITK
ncbi:hypothetical protein SynA1528_02104 [Synechococcus sp. A15-28]|nr:hypothetical protein SynA1528_02104 [Synechococcus sp. A15-28]